MFKDENRHYSLRKLSVGLASVLIGISFASSMNGNSVKADTVTSDSNGAQTVVKGSDTAIKNDAKDDTNVAESNTKPAPEATKKDPNAIAQDIKQKAIKTSEAVTKMQGTAEKTTKGNAPEVATKNATDGRQDAVKSTAESTLKSTVEADKQGLEMPAMQHADGNETTINVKGSKAITENMLKDAKTEVKEKQNLTDPAKSKLKLATLLTTTGKKLNAQMLSASKVISPANDTNGGFDEATWGKLNVNDWQGNVQGDYYQLTDYTGDANHVIVPNEADFEKAGISTSGKQVGVTSDLMHTIFRDKTTAANATVAFSKTDNKQVKAINADWHNTWGHSIEYINGSVITSNGKLTKFDGTNLDVSNVTNMSDMFSSNQISDLSPLASWKTNNVTDMNYMFNDNQISNLSPLASWKTNNVTDMHFMFNANQISNLSPLSNWHTDNVTDMNGMLAGNQINDLNPLAKWNVAKVINMDGMFLDNQISDLSPLANWDVSNVTDMGEMFGLNQISDLSPLANWKVDNVTDIRIMFDANSSVITQAKRVINFVYPAGYTGKKQDPVTQTVDLPQEVKINLTTKDSKPSNNILDWVTKTETPETPDPVYFQDYTVPEIKGLLEPDKTVISRQQADITKPINVTVTYKLVESNTNDAFALDSKHGLHEHANVNDNGGYDEDYWGKININDWNYTVNGNTITITGYKGINPSSTGYIGIDPSDPSSLIIHNGATGYKDNSHLSLIIPNGADFGFINGPDTNNTRVEISSRVMRNLANNAVRIGLSKTANNKIVASNADWRRVFGSHDNLTQMDLHNLDTSQVTDMSFMFQWYQEIIRSKAIMVLAAFNNSSDLDKSNLTIVGDLSDWDTSKVTNMTGMFYNASSLTDIGDLSKWDTSKVTNMAGMFAGTSSLINIGKLNNWDTSKVTNMSDMFAGASSLTDIGDLNNWNTSQVTNMSSMFANALRWMPIGRFSTGASSLTNIGKLNNWNTSKVTNMSDMFAGASGLTDIGDLNDWDTSKVTNMAGMFYNASGLTNIGDLSKWDTSKVTLMFQMFYNASGLTNIGDLNDWDTSKVTNMAGMFAGASSLTNIGELNNWNTSKVTNMYRMFYDASGLTNLGDLSKWDTSQVTDMAGMFYNTKALRYLNISNWNFANLSKRVFISLLSVKQNDLKHYIQNMFTNDTDLTVIANDVKLPDWYQTEITDAKIVWNNHMAVITNVPELINSNGAIDNLKIDDQDSSRSIFYDSKGSSDAIQVLKDVNQAYINKYEQDHPNPKYSLALDASVDQTDPIALANAVFKTSHKIIDVVQTNNSTRTIIVHLPNGTTQIMVQTIGLKRNAQKDLVTEIISSTAPWELDEANSSYTINGAKQAQTAYKQNSNIITFSSVRLPKVPGYKAKVARNNGLLLVSYLALSPEKPEINATLNELQFSNKLATNRTVQFNSTVKSNIVVKSDMYQVVNDDHNWQLPVIKSYELKFATNKDQITFAYTKDKQYNYRFVLTFKDGQYRLATFNKQGKLLKTYSIKSYEKLAKIIDSLVLMNIA